MVAQSGSFNLLFTDSPSETNFGSFRIALCYSYLSISFLRILLLKPIGFGSRSETLRWNLSISFLRILLLKRDREGENWGLEVCLSISFLRILLLKPKQQKFFDLILQRLSISFLRILLLKHKYLILKLVFNYPFNLLFTDSPSETPLIQRKKRAYTLSISFLRILLLKQIDGKIKLPIYGETFNLLFTDSPSETIKTNEIDSIKVMSFQSPFYGFSFWNQEA